MAQKRMFDKAIIEQGIFIDLPPTSKALYFLLGLYADDEGFIDPKGIMRTHLIEIDALKLLIAKKLVISFRSGVIVITDWKNNNWLDARRIKPTLYQEELKALTTIDNKYMLSGCLADAKPMLREYSIEESSIEENNTFDLFIEKFNKLKNSKYTSKCAKAKRQYQQRIKDGYTDEQLLEAVQNCMQDKFHQDNPKYLTPEFITRSDKLEMYLNKNSKPIKYSDQYQVDFENKYGAKPI